MDEPRGLAGLVMALCELGALEPRMSGAGSELEVALKYNTTGVHRWRQLRCDPGPNLRH